MKKTGPVPVAKAAILALADIKAAVEAFERGDSNVLDAVDAIAAAIDAYQAAAATHHEAA